MGPSRWVLVAALVISTAVRAGAVSCPASASLLVLAENQSADGSVSVQLDGQLLDPTSTCDGGGATTYTTTLTCTGSGLVQCGRIDGLRPGAWVHRVRVQVAGSDEQAQSQESVILASVAGVTNTLTWTVYPQTFVVRDATRATFSTRVDEAAAFAAAHDGARALVTFDRAVFPGAASPQQIVLEEPGATPVSDACPDDVTCSDGLAAGYCLGGARVVIDALDALAKPGAVVLMVDQCPRSVLRITGSDNVLRGIELRGSTKTNPIIPPDTVAFSGPDSQRNRIEQCIIRGPAEGDAVTAEGEAGAPGGPQNDNVVAASVILDAALKGVKVGNGAHVTVSDSCIHDNREAGIHVTDGGAVTAVRNVIQLHRQSGPQAGLLLGVPNEIVSPDTALTTDGNVVRFAGLRGISVQNAGTLTASNDVVVENHAVGARVETLLPDTAPTAVFRGVTFACNYKRLSGTCDNDPTQACGGPGDCPGGTCTYPPDPPEVEADGAGAVRAATCDGCQVPSVDFGTGGRSAGRNAFTQNENPLPGRSGVNLSNLTGPTAGAVSALGNQWEHCGPEPTCNAASVRANDMRPRNTAASVGTPTGPRGGPAPSLVRIVPVRPRAGEFVRVYNDSIGGSGGTFNAVDGVACTPSGNDGGSPLGLPADPCSPENPAVAQQNRDLAQANHVTLTMGGVQSAVEVHAVTPSMLVFKMPTDCFAPATLVVTRGNDAPSAPIGFCDPAGCTDRPAGTPCDDGNACTMNELCDGAGACVGGSAIQCSGPCLTGACHADTGCVLAATDPICDDGNPCTADRCVAAATCQNVALADGDRCPAADRCREAGTCQAGTCDGGAPRQCNDGNFCTDDLCDPTAGCQFPPVTGVRLTSCRVDTLRARLDPLLKDGTQLPRRLKRHLDRADVALTRAESAQRPSRRRAALAKARSQLRAFMHDVKKGRKVLGDALVKQLLNDAKLGIANLKKLS